MVPAPVSFPSGDTLYSGETTVVTAEPIFFAPGTDSTVAPATGNLMPPGTEGSQCSTAPSNGATIRGRDGKFLGRWACPDSGKCWVQDFDHPDDWCWEIDHPAYIAPAIGISQAVAVALAAAETASRANQEADLARSRAQAAEMRATALLHTAADKAEVSSVEAQAAQELAAGTAKDLKAQYDRAAALANFDARNRATRTDMATGHVVAPVMVPSAPVITDPAQALMPSCGGSSSSSGVVSPSRPSRPASTSAMHAGWFGEALACFGGNVAPPRTTSSSNQPADRRRRKWPNVEGK